MLVLPKINTIEVLRPVSITYTAELPVREQTVMFLSALLKAERVRPGTRTGSRALGCFAQAVLILRWYLDGVRLAQLAAEVFPILKTL